MIRSCIPQSSGKLQSDSRAERCIALDSRLSIGSYDGRRIPGVSATGYCAVGPVQA